MPPSSPASTSLPAAIPYELSQNDVWKYRGCWVAISPDGQRLIAGSKGLTALDELVRSAGEDPEAVLLEQVPEGEYIASGAELS